MKRVLTRVASGPSHTLLLKFILIHLHLVPRCIRTTEHCLCCLYGPDLYSGGWAERCRTMALFFQVPVERSAAVRSKEKEEDKRKKLCTLRNLVPMEKKITK